MSTTTMVGFFAGLLTTISFLPQVAKTWKSRSASDLSLGMFSVFSVGVMFWLVYGFLIQEPPIIFWNLITLVLVLTLLILYFWNRIFVVIGPGQAGALYRPLTSGTVTDYVYPEGLQVLFPLNKMTIYDTRVQVIQHDFIYQYFLQLLI